MLPEPQVLSVPQELVALQDLRMPQALRILQTHQDNRRRRGFLQVRRPRPRLRNYLTKSKSPVFTDEALNSEENLFYTLKEEPHPQVLFTFGFSNLKPEASNVSTKSTTHPFRYMAEVAST